MNFREVRKTDMPKVLAIRNSYLAGLRTPYPLTLEMQEEFYDSVICNRNANARFWTAMDGDRIIGMVGFVNIEWENRCAELSVAVEHESDLTISTIKRVLDLGFSYLNLKTIYDITYGCNPWVASWCLISRDLEADVAILPNRKYWEGQYYDAFYASYCNKLG